MAHELKIPFGFISEAASTISTIANSTGDFLTAPTDGGLITMRTAAQVLGDIGAGANIPNIYCNTWNEVKAAVVNINTNYNGGNIYVSGRWYMTESVSWDLTNINFYGFGCDWCFTQTEDGTIIRKITVTAGNPTFHNISFNGTWESYLSNTLSNETSREIFSFTGGVHDIVFNTCNFADIVGGTGTNKVIEVVGVDANDSVVLNFYNCIVASHNNSIAFTHNGLKI